MDQSRFIRGLLDDPADPQQPQYVPANDFGPRAYGLLNTLFPDPNVMVGDAIKQYQAGDGLTAFETMFGAIPATGALSVARGRFGGAVMSPVDELFHGSPVQGLTTLTASERGPLGPGVYTSPSRQISGHYAGEGGHVYQVPHEGLDIYRGDGHRTDDQWFGYKDDQRRLIEAVPDEHKSAVVPVIEKMWSGDGYPLYQRIRGILGGDEQAQALFKKAGFHGISGQIDGPETLIFGNVPLKDASPKAPGIIAYHGSPHSFDKFDLSKIGTGEGAQAYGHGLYFAESEPVARSYRDALKPGYFNNVLTIDGRDFGSDMGNYYLRNAVEKAVPSPGAGFASGKETFDFYNKEMSDAVYKALLKAETGHDVNSVAASTVDAVLKKNAPYEDEAAAVDEIRRALLGHIQNNVTSRPNGSMYQVRINADPNAFLDWDKPFAEQSPIVQKTITTLAKTAPEPKKGPSIRNRQAILNNDGSVPGDILYNNIGGHNFPAETSSALREAGIPGIKYLDAGSRGSGEGSRNYVVFDDSLIDILKKYGLIGLLGGGAAASGVSGMNNPPSMPNSAPGL